MYFGTLVTPARNDQDSDTWQRDMDASRIAGRPSRWREFWRGLAKLFA